MYYSGMNKLQLRKGKVCWCVHRAVFVADIQDAQSADLNMYQAHHH